MNYFSFHMSESDFNLPALINYIFVGHRILDGFFSILSRCCHIFFLLALFSRKNLLSSLNVVLCTKCIFINSDCFYNFLFIASFEGFDHDVSWFSYPHICCFGDLLGLDVYPYLPTLHFRNSDFAHWTARCPSSLLVLFIYFGMLSDFGLLYIIHFLYLSLPSHVRFLELTTHLFNSESAVFPLNSLFLNCSLESLH